MSDDTPRPVTFGADLRRLAARLQLQPGEAAELLERVLGAGAEGRNGLTPWERRRARHVLEVYAARKRAIARLARQGRL
ncbi:MAG: hypothetical protein HY332_25465 [Chloroflexi bacterium]|nr:hypothetical protein [Chloroflexota bacterium]